MFLSENLRKGILHLGGGTGKHCQTAWAALHTCVLTRLAATEQGGNAHVTAWADEAHLAWAADWALGCVALIHLGHVGGALHWEDAHTACAGGVLATGLAVVLAHLAHHLGTDRAGDINISVGVLDVHGRALWVLVVLDLGGVLDALDGLDDVLA